MTDSLDADRFLDPDGARDYLRSWKDRVDQAAAKTQTLTERLGALRTSAKDDNGIAEVTIDSAGVLTKLELSERIHRLEPDVVSRAVMRALAETVPAENLVRAGHAACSYSWRMPPRRSRLRMLRCAIVAGSAIGVGSANRGRALA